MAIKRVMLPGHIASFRSLFITKVSAELANFLGKDFLDNYAWSCNDDLYRQLDLMQFNLQEEVEDTLWT